jgi:hypothetical protein
LKWNIHVSSLILSFGKKLNLLKTITLKRIIANITAFLLRRQHLTTLYRSRAKNKIRQKSNKTACGGGYIS